MEAPAACSRRQQQPAQPDEPLPRRRPNVNLVATAFAREAETHVASTQGCLQGRAACTCTHSRVRTQSYNASRPSTRERRAAFPS